MQSKLPCCAQLCCVLLLPVLRSDRQHGGNLRGEKQGAVKDQIHVEKEKRRKVVHNNTYYTRYCSMFEIKHTAQHDTAPQQTARHGTAWLRTALRCAAGLYIAGLI